MAELKRDPRGQGDLGERSAMLYFGARGDGVFVPIFHSPDIDLIVAHDGQILRVQVKTTSAFRKGRWNVSVCTRGGNRSWSGLVKRLDATRYDTLFVLVGDGRRWLIPSSAIDAGNLVRVGGPKYAQYEIERGEPLPAWVASLDSASSWRDSRAVKGDAL